MKFLQRVRPGGVIAITIVIAAVMIISSIVELSESKKETIHLLTESSYSLIETIRQSSLNTLNSSEEIENIITERLLNNAFLIKQLDSLNLLTTNKLIEIGKKNSIYRINIFDNKGNRILSNRIPEPGHIHGEENINRYFELYKILTGEEDEIIIGLKDAEFTNAQRYAIAVSRVNNRGAIVVNLDAADFLEFRKKIGIGKIINDLSDNHRIKYLALQDSIGILAANSTLDSISSIESDAFLEKALTSDSILTRIIYYKGEEVFEAVMRLYYEGETAGLFRLGLTMEEVKLVEERMTRRLVLISLILAAISIITLSIIFTNQTLKSVSTEYGKFKSFTASVLENMGDAVIVTDTMFNITLANKSAQQLLFNTKELFSGKPLESFSPPLLIELKKYLAGKYSGTETLITPIRIDKEDKFLLLNFSTNLNTEGTAESYTIVIRDFTEVHKLEEETKRNEKLSAMGELASGVAHEIRNPINAIGMIAQRLDKEFIVDNNSDEYHNITSLLRHEVNRINRIITQFLSYAKPLDIQIKPVNTKEYFNELFLLFDAQSKHKNITLNFELKDIGVINIDPELLKQTLINIVQNAFDATDKNGNVEIKYSFSENNFLIEISDDGRGIAEENLKRIFDLYYTSKKDGNGLGLSIAQKIVAQHNGSISVKSKLNSGTKFIISIPQ
ncbi:MAG: ATP-binding protein [Ignavibacteriales bacterium]|nr:MAG: ATP-binding protein [Ignavibacteriales bacterium]